MATRRYPHALTAGLLLFVAAHFFFEPYRRVRIVGESGEPVFLDAGASSRILLPPFAVSPGEQFRVVARVRWENAAGDSGAGWKTARIVFASFDERDRWISSRHELCSVSGSGSRSFSEVFRIPDDAAIVRFELQHGGIPGRMGIESFRVEQVVPRPAMRWIFGGLLGIWLAFAVWSARILRLAQRRRGWPALLSAGLIAVGMLLPGRFLGDARSQVADWVRPAPPAEPAFPPPPAMGAPDAPPSHVPPATPSAPIHAARNRVARTIRYGDPHRLAHLGLFFLFGLACGGCFLAAAPSWRRIFRVLLGGAVYAAAAELLQVAELSRNVRIGDFGHNLTGFAVGLAFFLAVRLARRGMTTQG